jgi:hypothetical protein
VGVRIYGLLCQGKLPAASFSKARIGTLGFDFFANGGMERVLRGLAGVELPVTFSVMVSNTKSPILYVLRQL